MSLAVATAADGAADGHDGLWLYPWNRRLRNLQAISVRNLVASPHPVRPRGKTIDDDDLPNSLETPSKMQSKGEIHNLHQSRSFADLQSPVGPTAQHKRQFDAKRRRRSSTLPWGGSNPRTRQANLEAIIRSRMADTWFSLHCRDSDKAIYISEIIESTTNPNFKSFDLTACGPHISRLDHVVLKLYAKTADAKGYVFVVEMDQHLQSLEFLGKSLESFRHPLPPNSILFHFSDGVFGNITDIPPARAPIPSRSPKVTDGPAVPMASFDQLMRMLKLEECIQDAAVTREQLETHMNEILEGDERAFKTQIRLLESQERLSVLRQGIAGLKRQIRLKTKRKEELMRSMKARKEAMERGRREQGMASSHFPEAQTKLRASTELLGLSKQATKSHIQQICESLQSIYPIEPVPNKPLAFTICGLSLPNSSFEDVDRDMVAAALGYTAHLVYVLSFYLFAHLPYPIHPCSSTSLIQDPVSTSLRQRTFPLYPVNSQYRFEYGVFLLNKDIEFLLNKQGLRALDIRHTLPNLKYLVYFLTEGTPRPPSPIS